MVYLGIVSGIFGIIMLVIHERNADIPLFAKMDFKTGEFAHKETIVEHQAAGGHKSAPC